ncbi:MAG: serine protease [Anaerolineales bacterium]|jgi:serine protease Do
MDSSIEVNQSLVELVEKIRPSIVRIQTSLHGFGTGTVWHPDGLIITNAHVVSGKKASIVLADNAKTEANVIAVSRRLDLAALKVECGQLPAVELGTSGDLKPGSIVVAMGFPWGASDGATMGVFIGMNQAWGPGAKGGRELIAASLHLRPGHSGGPMVDAAGRLVGINTMMNGPNVGVAIPVDDAKGWLKKALARRHDRIMNA